MKLIIINKNKNLKRFLIVVRFISSVVENIAGRGLDFSGLLLTFIDISCVLVVEEREINIVFEEFIVLLGR